MLKLNIQKFGGRGTASNGKRTSNKVETIAPSKPRLGTINGEEIRSFTLYGEETGEAGEFTSIKELYEQMQEIKKLDRQEMGYTDEFEVQINTDTSTYTGAKVVKYKGRYKIKIK